MNITALTSNWPVHKPRHPLAGLFSPLGLLEQRQDSVRFSARKSWQSEPEAHYPVVVVGGGMAGMTAMYELVKKRGVKDAILMESEGRFGGNAASVHETGGVLHSIGATIFLPGNANHRKLWKELELPLEPKHQLKPEIFVIDGKRFTAFGSPEDLAQFPPEDMAHKRARQGFQKFLKDLAERCKSKVSAPVVPIWKAAAKAFRKWDSTAFSDYMKPYAERFGALVERMVEAYIRSDLAQTNDKSSAYVAMLDMEDLNHERYVLPGGNGFVIERLKQKIHEAAGTEKSSIQLNHTVEWVENDPKNNRVKITYKDGAGKSHRISADTVLMAAPYQHVPKLMDVPEQVAAQMRAMPKSSYTVVNVFLNKTPLRINQFYVPLESKTIADMFLMNANPDETHEGKFDEPSVLHLYTPGTGLRKNKTAFEAELKTELLRLFPEIKPEMIDGIRLNSFRYSMGAPEPGQVKAFAEMRKDFGRISVINSDGGAVPSLTVAIDEAQRGVDFAMKHIPSSHRPIDEQGSSHSRHSKQAG